MLMVVSMIALLSLFTFPKVIRGFDQAQVKSARLAVLTSGAFVGVELPPVSFARKLIVGIASGHVVLHPEPVQRLCRRNCGIAVSAG